MLLRNVASELVFIQFGKFLKQFWWLRNSKQQSRDTFWLLVRSQCVTRHLATLPLIPAISVPQQEMMTTTKANKSFR